MAGKAWALPIRRVDELWRPALLLGLLGAATIVLTNHLLTDSGRFSPTFVTLIALAGWGGFALALVGLAAGGSWRIASLGIFVLTAVVLPVAVLIAYRWRTGIALDVHDGMFQTEIVAAGLLNGHDPYGTDFTRTALVQWFHYTPDGAAIAHHYIYYPLVVLTAVPLVLLERSLGLGADLRPLLLGTGVVAFVLVARLPWSWPWRYSLIVLLFLNPFSGLLEGRNDLLWMTPLVASIVLALDGRIVASSFLLGVASAFKFFAIPFAVFTAVGLFVRWRRGSLPDRALAWSLAGLALPLILTVAPFVGWNASAFWQDTVGWLIASRPGFPIYGFGLGQALLITHVVPSATSPFPFGAVQAIVALPVLVIGLRSVIRQPSLANVLGPATTLLAVVMICGRFTNDNYLAALFFLFATSIAARRNAELAATQGERQPELVPAA